MRILFVSSVFPQDFDKNVYGIFQRMRIWLDAIKLSGAELDILFLAPHGIDTDSGTCLHIEKEMKRHWDIQANVKLCKRDVQKTENLVASMTTTVRALAGLTRHPYFRPFIGRQQKKAFAECMDKSPDAVFFQRIYATGPATSFPLDGVKSYIDLDDVEHLRFAREIRQPPYWRSKRLNYLQVPVLWREERNAILGSTCSFVCSQADQKYLQRTMRVRNIKVVPNVVPWVENGSLSSDQNVLFIGNGRFGPNKVAAEYLIYKVWPHLVKLCPDAHLYIAGPGWKEFSKSKNQINGVNFLGFVPDLNALYRKIRVMCCPIQSGSGTRIKILEAASYGVPVVSTPLGAEGIELVPEDEILLRNDVQSMAEACAELLMNDTRAHSLSLGARERVRTSYNRDSIVCKVKDILSCKDREEFCPKD